MSKNILFGFLAILLTSHNSVNSYEMTGTFKQDRKIAYSRGEYLFKRDCAGCHALNMKQVMTAPALAGITKKRNIEWLFRYTKYSKKMKEMKDPIALQLSAGNWGAMPSFPNLNKRDFNALYFFIEEKAME